METGITPLEFMLAILRNEANSDLVRMEAAEAAAPYVHARLAHIETRGRGEGQLGRSVAFSCAFCRSVAREPLCAEAAVMWT